MAELVLRLPFPDLLVLRQLRWDLKAKLEQTQPQWDLLAELVLSLQLQASLEKLEPASLEKLE